MSKTKTESPRFHCPDPPVGCGLSLLLLQKHPDDPEGRCVTCVNEGAPKEPPARRHDYGGFGEQWVARNDVLRRRLTGSELPRKGEALCRWSNKMPAMSARLGCRRRCRLRGLQTCSQPGPAVASPPRAAARNATEARRKCPRCLRQWVAPGDTICAAAGVKSI